MLFGCFFNSHFVFVSGKHISFLNACAFGFAVIRTGNQTVTPYYSGGAGIGSSSSAHCGDITISNAVITATGGKGAPGIGMGAGKSASAPRMGNINIKSSTITATGGLRASAIGFPNEYCFDYSKVTTLTGGTINIETVESSETFLNRLTCDLGTSNTIIIYKLVKEIYYGLII